MGLLDFLSLKIRTPDAPQPVAGSVDIGNLAASVYFKSAAVSIAVGYMQTAFNKCEIRTFERGEETKGHLYYRLNVSPNPNQNASQLKNQAVAQLMVHGRCLIVPVGDYLYVADPSFSVDERQLHDNVFRGISIEGKSYDRDFPASNAIFLTMGNPKAKSFIDGMYDQYGRLMAAAAKSFESGCGTKWKLDTGIAPTGDRTFARKDEEERKDPTGQLKTFAQNANAIYIQTRGTNLEKIDVDGCNAAEVVSLRKEIFETAAQVYMIPPPMLFGNMTNMRDIVDTFLTFPMDSMAQTWTEELTRKMVTPFDWGKGDRISVDTSRVKHIDIFEKAPAVSQLIGSGFSLNEMRDQLGWPFIDDPMADDHLITRNYGALDEVLRQMAQQGGEK